MIMLQVYPFVKLIQQMQKSFIISPFISNNLSHKTLVPFFVSRIIILEVCTGACYLTRLVFLFYKVL